jgi:hypothetical protein
MSTMDTLEMLGRSYAGLGAIFSGAAGAMLIYLGNVERADPTKEAAGRMLMISGVAVIVIGVALWYLANKYEGIAAISGIWLAVTIIIVIIAAIRGDYKPQL